MGALRPATAGDGDGEEQLPRMRAHLPELARRVDRSDLHDLARHTGEATENRQAASTHRAGAEAMRDERALRARLAVEDPDRHGAEEEARNTHLIQQRRAARERARRSIENDARSHGHQPPSPDHRGSGLGI